jgi:hypothetical protein
MARPTVIVGKADAADAPQRKKKRRRAPRIVFPDPDRHRKPAKIHTYIREYDPMRHRCPLWLTQRCLMESRLFEERCARAAIKAAREARKAARAAARAVRRAAQQATAQAATFHDD